MQFRIRQYTFRAPDHFVPGHRLSPGEAQALNSLMADQIRNNVTRIVDRAIRDLAPDELLSQQVQASLQDQIEAYAQGYHFVEFKRPFRLGPIELEARALAEEKARAMAEARGLGPSDPLLALWADKWFQDPGLQSQARTNVALAEKVVREGLEELLANPDSERTS